MGVTGEAGRGRRIVSPRCTEHRPCVGLDPTTMRSIQSQNQESVAYPAEPPSISLGISVVPFPVICTTAVLNTPENTTEKPSQSSRGSRMPGTLQEFFIRGGVLKSVCVLSAQQVKEPTPANAQVLTEAEFHVLFKSRFTVCSKDACPSPLGVAGRPGGGVQLEGQAVATGQSDTSELAEATLWSPSRSLPGSWNLGALGASTQQAPGSSSHCQVCAPASCESRYGMYVEVLPLMASLQVEARTPTVQIRSLGRPRATGSAQGHSPGHEQEPSLKPALRPHSRNTGCTQASWGLQSQTPAQLISLEILERRTCLRAASPSPEAAG
ncbi:uncharacterized protein LOC117799876 isoform X2 [Ailuropoda melanoleuca]|uniref:uncharacterized protein LOC117799876 isoform X2 n=1 Tax=Ailuropoda melanoleuca TaxID=9646 RepID=UPI00149408F3|nr:uncharacterized protein LOC117799876 isoform X2 [Ailuropoda melanoleuca]